MKILLLDIETAPNLVHVWGLWKQNVATNQIIDAGYVMCWAAKWYGKKEVYFDSIHQATSIEMLGGIHDLIDRADAVVHYNGKSFDMPTLNKEFITHGFLPPSPYKQIDLCDVAKKEFRFPSNKLEYIARALRLDKQKIKHEGHELWIKCMKGDPEAWQRMREYNMGDVTLLEEVYERMKPWVRNHPNFGTYAQNAGHVCPNCGSDKLQKRGWAYTQVNKFTRYQCMSCGSWSREPISELNTEDRRRLLRPVLS